jgi:hypothetical protein
MAEAPPAKRLRTEDTDTGRAAIAFSFSIATEAQLGDLTIPALRKIIRALNLRDADNAAIIF